MKQVRRLLTDEELLTVTHNLKRPAVDLEFNSIKYTVRHADTDQEKTILNGISGKFHAGEVTAIMGTSGAGKSTLMNILAGLVRISVTGSITTNGVPIHLKTFNKLSAYIQQEDHNLQCSLTVCESLMVAARLKLGSEMTAKQIKSVVTEVLGFLGMTNAGKTMTECLSGGQRRRLSIALELVNNPSVIFLDEPTTGLDEVATKQVVSLLELLASKGRAIICTLHQPSPIVVDKLDKLYVLARGYCVYQGVPDRMVEFLSNAGFQCPITYTPTDYIIETVHGDEIENVRKLTESISNGEISVDSENEDIKKKFLLWRQASMASVSQVRGDPSHTYTFATSYIEQVWILSQRMLKQKCRGVIQCYLYIALYLLCAIFFSCLFYNVGQNGDDAFSNYRLLVSCSVFFMFAGGMIPILLNPASIRSIQPEYFNRWYSLRAYFTAKRLTEFPLMFIMSAVFSMIVYYFTSQPLEPGRIIWFLLFSVIMNMISEAYGEMVGSLMSETTGSVVYPCSVVLPLGLAFYGCGFASKVNPHMKFLKQFSYFHFVINGYLTSIYSEAPKLECKKDVYCHYSDPSVLLKDMVDDEKSCYLLFFVCVVFYLMFVGLSYVALVLKVNHELKNRISIFIRKCVKDLLKYLQVK